MSKIKVLHIVKSLGRGGAEILLLETLKKHNKNKFEFYYIYFLPWKNELVNDIEANGGKVFNVAAKNNLQIIIRLFAIVKFIKKNRIQLIHCHLPWAGIVGRLAGALTHKPVIYTEHNKQERYHSITKFVNNLTYGLQNLVFAVSQDVKFSIQKNIKSSTEIKVIFNGVDTTFFRNSETDKFNLKEQLNIRQNLIVIGNVCVFRKQKRLDKWIDLFEQINLQNPNTIGLLVGAGILFDDIKKYIDEKNLLDKIILVGLQTEVKKYYNIIDIFISTSEFEGLPIALLEAMSMQCAVAVTNAGGVKEVVVNNANGVSVGVENYTDLVDPVCGLINDKILLQEFGLAARQTVIDKFSISTTTSQIEENYFEVLSTK